MNHLLAQTLPGDPQGFEVQYIEVGTLPGSGLVAVPCGVQLGRAKVLEELVQRCELARQPLLVAAQASSQGSAAPRAAFERATTALARALLPPEEAGGLPGRERDLLLEASGELLQRVPWEALPVPANERRGRTRTTTPLGLQRRLLHLVRGGDERTPRPTGRRFLILLDPDGSIGRGLSSENRLLLADHGRRLHDLLEGLGFECHLLGTGAAFRDQVEEQLASPELCGIYCFAHAHVEAGLGFLQLTDDRLYHFDPANRSCRARFTFLNACSSAAPSLAGPGGSWQGLAASFAMGSASKTVIGSTTELPAVPAARAAEAFFELAAQGCSLAEALQQVREQSHRRYLAGTPDLSWSLYRLFATGVGQRLSDLLPAGSSPGHPPASS